MALVAVICSACSHIGFARADALPRVLTCFRCHGQQRSESRPPRYRLGKREDALRQKPCEISGTEIVYRAYPRNRRTRVFARCRPPATILDSSPVMLPRS